MDTSPRGLLVNQGQDNVYLQAVMPLTGVLSAASLQKSKMYPFIIYHAGPYTFLRYLLRGLVSHSDITVVFAL